jgi:elongation factor Ts
LGHRFPGREPADPLERIVNRIVKRIAKQIERPGEVMEISATQVKELREKTNAGMMDCKKALVEAAGDFAKAEEWLRQKGLAAAAKKASRVASEGAVGSYIHMGGKIGVMVEINCETDFVARNELFQAFVKDVAMHVAATNPLYLRREDVPAEIVEKEREIYKAQLKEQGKPEKVWDKILEGKLDRYYKDTCLLDQGFVKEPEKSVQQLATEMVAKLGENIQIRRFIRFQLGEGLGA